MNDQPSIDATELTEQLTEQQLDQLDFGAMEQSWRSVLHDYGSFFPQGQAPSFADLIAPGGSPLTWGNVLRTFINTFVHELLESGQLIVMIVVLALLSIVAQSLQQAFVQPHTSRIANVVLSVSLIALVIQSFRLAVDLAQSTIESMTTFMMGLLPLMMALLISSGSVTTVALLHPLIVAMVNGVTLALQGIVFPLLFFSAVLHLTSSLTERYKVSDLADLLRRIAVSVMGVLITVFLGVLSIKGASGAVQDGVSMRTAKFMAGNFVPVVGRTFAEAADTIVAASLLVKNGIGIAGLVILLFICAFPAVKMLTLALVYQGAAAVLQPLGETPLVVCLRAIGQTLIYVFGVMAIVALLFFFTIMTLIVTGNVAMMMKG